VGQPFPIAAHSLLFGQFVTSSRNDNSGVSLLRVSSSIWLHRTTLSQQHLIQNQLAPDPTDKLHRTIFLRFGHNGNYFAAVILVNGM
jgi:hypothetical protein